MRSRALLLALVLALLACGCARRGAASTLPASPLSLATLWTHEVPECAGVEIVAAEDRFLIGSPAGGISALSSTDGKIQWSRGLKDGLAGSPVISLRASREGAPPALAAAPLANGAVEVMSLDTGEPVATWIPKERIRHLVGLPSALIGVSEEGVVRRFGADTLTETWMTRLTAVAPARPGVCGKPARILIGLADGRLVALDEKDGKIRWKKNLRSPLAADPSCEASGAYAATGDNRLHALSVHGRWAGLKWRVRSGADPAATPMPSGDVVLHLSKDTYLYGFDEDNGHLLFRARLDRRPGPAILLGDLVFVGGPNARRLDAFRLPSGRSAGSYDLPEGMRFVTPPVAASGRIAIGVARYGESACRIVALAPAAGAAASPER